MHPTNVEIIETDASYRDICSNLQLDTRLQHIYACAMQGVTFFLYRGGSDEVITVLPGGSCHVVDVNLRHLHTDANLLYVLAYA
jgi:hypothetical protein